MTSNLSDRQGVMIADKGNGNWESGRKGSERLGERQPRGEHCAWQTREKETSNVSGKEE
jgi:hypothetical protein